MAAGLKAKVGPWTLATVRHRVAVLSTAHRLKQVANPCEQPAIGEVGYIYRLEHSKTQQAGVTATSTPDKPVLDRVALALQDWLEMSGVTEGAIFRRLWRRRIGAALSPTAIGEIVQRRVRLAGLEGDFGGHSLRSGFVTEASRQGVALPAIMQLTEHRSVSSVIGYFHSGEASSNPAARLLED
ncbi:hypothetical protein NB709_003084 [Xanthomonas sacchari]|nr:hypothetical protein [Xanthomonas sacchari]